MEILTKGLANRSGKSALDSEKCAQKDGRPGMQDIQLAHARNSSQPEEFLDDETAARSWIETPYNPSIVTTSGPSKSVAKRTTSKVLQALEINERNST
jgi:hypothetical protein